ncbi:MAG: starch-binding protein, partial [Muribaculaceae bacterium]|nr:starch-binding protein [Muribaculaceae bacterium]
MFLLISLSAARAVDFNDGLYVFADVTWSHVNLYLYNSDSDVYHTWPGEAMSKDDDTGLWYYKIPDGYQNGRVIFYCDDRHRYPGNNAPGLELNNKTMVFKGDGNGWEEYTYEVLPDVGWSIHFHNNVGWENVWVHIDGPGSHPDSRMESDLNSGIFDYSFSAPEGASLHCSFYTLDGSTQSQTTSSFVVIDGHIYTISGDKGPKSEYDPNQALPEAEYWLDPAKPSAKDYSRFYFNRAYNAGGALRNVDEIYLYCGLIKMGDSDSSWTGAPASWDNLPDKYKMQRDADNPDLFYIDFSPSMVEWFDVDADGSYAKLALIIRNQSGNVKQHSEDLFIDLRYTAPVGDGLGAVQSYTVGDDASVTFLSENGTLTLTPWSTNVVKVFTLRNSATHRAERRSISVIDDDAKVKSGIDDASFEISEETTAYRLTIPGGVSVVVDKETTLLTFYNPGQTATPALEELQGLVNRQGNVSVSFMGMNDRGFYGGGYQGNLINWEGKTMSMNNNQVGNWGQGGSLSRNICIPFYVSTEGYGVYFDDHYRYASISPSKNGTVYTSNSQDPIAYYFIGGGTMESVVENYTGLTGRQQLPPFWALGYITSKFSFATREEAEATVSKTKAVNIPIDGIVFDIHWQTHYGSDTNGMGRIDWATDRYPDPVEMLAGLRAQNVHPIAITEPYFTGNSGNYDYLVNNRYLADEHVSGMGWLESGDNVGLLDITNQDAVDWFKDLYKARTVEGIESWWLDLGEPERHDSDSQYLGGTVDQVHNEYGLLWNKLAFEAVSEATPDKRFITMPRAGTSGMQRYNAFPWTGDIARSWAGLAAQVPALVSAAMSGVSYLGSDIGGFTATGTNADLYRRWVQLGVFYPSLRTHSATKPEVWQSDYNSVRDDVRDAINLRYAYLPYTYSQAYAYTCYGTPIARPANYADVDKSYLKNEIGAYYWGPDMYVAPVLDNTTTKHITFPEGDWLDMTDFSTIYQGHTSVTYSAPHNVIPRFMRRGSFVTRYRQETFTSTAEIDESALVVDYFAPKDATLSGSTLYQDDHADVNAIADGKYLVTHFTGQMIDDGGLPTLAIYLNHEGNGWSGMPDTRDIIIRIHDFNIKKEGGALSSDEVLLYDLGGRQNSHRQARAAQPDMEARMRAAAPSDDTRFSAVNSEDALRNASGAVFYHDADANHLYLRVPAVSHATDMALSLGQSKIVAGMDNVLSEEAMTLRHSDGIVTYSAPEGVDGLQLEIYT